MFYKSKLSKVEIWIRRPCELRYFSTESPCFFQVISLFKRENQNEQSKNEAFPFGKHIISLEYQLKIGVPHVEF